MLLFCHQITGPFGINKKGLELVGRESGRFCLDMKPTWLKEKNTTLIIHLNATRNYILAFFKNENLKKSWTLLQMFINDPLLSSDSFGDNIGGLCSLRGGVQFSLFQMFLLRRL